jgi:hypothetical protein
MSEPEDYRKHAHRGYQGESIMRRMMLSLAVGALVLSGCATTTGNDYYSNVDYAKIARIENAARAVGVNVYWVNFPTKSTASVN